MLRVRGDYAEVWQSERIGNLYRYTLVGEAEDWTADAERYWLTAGGEVEVRFYVKSEGKVQLELRGAGRLVGQPAQDGQLRRQIIQIEGTKLWIPTGEPQPSE